MLGKVLLGLFLGLETAILSVEGWAGEPRTSERGRPDGLFGRLDANRDGAITAEEIPDGAPEPLKAFLKKADKDKDKKITTEEFREALKAGPPRMLWPTEKASPRGGPDAAEPKPTDRAKAGSQRPQRPRPPGPRLPDAKILFATMDKNHDGLLTPEEFAAGMRQFHRESGRPGGERGAGFALGPHREPGRGMGPGFGMGLPHTLGGPGSKLPPISAGSPRPPWITPRPWVPPLWLQPGGPWHSPQSWGRETLRPPAPVGGPRPEQFKKMVSAMVREEVAKILKEKAEATRSRPPRSEVTSEQKK